jgi:tetratricopeptide (TPR) repeat protein
MKAAFQAGAAALEGFQKGDQAAMESQRERWQEAVKVAAENNRNELERYNAAWKKTEHNMSERAAKLNEIALSKQDVIMKAAIDSGNLGQAFKLLEDRQKAQEHLDEVLIREQDRRELRDVALGRYNMAKDRYDRQVGEPLSDETAVRIADQWVAGDHTILKDLSKGVNGPADLRKVNEIITKRMSDEGLSPKDVIAKQAELKAFTKEALTVAGRAGNIDLAVKEAQDAMPVLIASSRRTPRNGYAFWNELENKYEVQTGSPEYAQFVANLNSMINIYGRAISGTAKGTVSDLSHAREMLNPNQPTAAFEGSLKGMQQELDIAYNAPKKVIDEMRTRWSGGKPSGAAGEPSAPAVAGSAAELPPEALEAIKSKKEGEPTDFRNGQQWTIKNGQPVRLK